ncbi:hypothetical protein HanIR_Chr12g0596031 [Helianthus annuus]|nr:hypothetical protein HanIR_Chr12g0596031 [Helianthus annuus]
MYHLLVFLLFLCHVFHDSGLGPKCKVHIGTYIITKKNFDFICSCSTLFRIIP